VVAAAAESAAILTGRSHRRAKHLTPPCASMNVPSGSLTDDGNVEITVLDLREKGRDRRVFSLISYLSVFIIERRAIGFDDSIVVSGIRTLRITCRRNRSSTTLSSHHR